MEEIYSLYIGYAPDCTTTNTTATAATCPPGTGKSGGRGGLEGFVRPGAG